MKQAEEYRLKLAEEQLLQNAKEIVESAAKLAKSLSCDNTEGIDYATNKMLENLDLKAYFEDYLKIAAEEHLNDPEFEFLDASMMGRWVRITRGNAEKYASLKGKEREEFVQTLYNNMLIKSID